MADRTCSKPECDEPHHSRGFCDRHYRQAKRRGELPPRPSAEETLHALSNVDMDAKLADCAVCGPAVQVKVRYRQQRKSVDVQCLAKARERNKRWRERREEDRPDGATSYGRLRWVYKLTVADYERMLTEQAARCAICQGEFPKLLVDHDHETGAVRGLLCAACNAGIGCLRDDIARLERAIAYLTAANTSAHAA